MTRDGIQFIASFFDIISTAALHTYISALPLAPRTQLSFNYAEQPWVVSKADEVWSCSQILRGHDKDVRSVAFSPDGFKIVSGSVDRTVRVWDAQQGVRLAEQPELRHVHNHTVFGAVFSPNGSRIASSSQDGTVCQWDAYNGDSVSTGNPSSGHAISFSSVAYSPPDGLCIVSCSGDKLHIWDADEGKPIGGPLVGHKNSVYCVTFSPDGKQIASASADKTVRIWDVQAPAGLIPQIQQHTAEVYCVAWSPNGSTLASGLQNGSICLWEVQTRRTIFDIQEHTDSVSSVAFSPDSDGSKLVSASEDRTIRLWDVWTGQCIGKLLQGDYKVWSVAFSPDGQQIASGSSDHTVRIWEMDEPRKITFTPCPNPYSINETLGSTDTLSFHPHTEDITFSYADSVGDDGWIYTSTGRRVVWVPIRGGKITIGSGSLTVEGPGSIA
jgi:WD40 repeat protein